MDSHGSQPDLGSGSVPAFTICGAWIAHLGVLDLLRVQWQIFFIIKLNDRAWGGRQIAMSQEKATYGPSRWLRRRSKHQPSNLTTWFWSPGPIWGKDRPDFHRLSSDLRMHSFNVILKVLIPGWSNMIIHTFNACILEAATSGLYIARKTIMLYVVPFSQSGLRWRERGLP